LYEFARADQTHVRVELHDQGDWGAVAQISLWGEFRLSRRFETTALAMEWADAERVELENEGLKPMLTLRREEQLTIVKAALDLCHRCESLVESIRRGTVTPEDLANTEKALRPMKAGLSWYRHALEPSRREEPLARQPGIGELLFEFMREADGAYVRCELLDHGDYGVEAQFTVDGSLLVGRRFDTLKQALHWAEAERADLEKGGDG
jgi:hypothetical protein